VKKKKNAATVAPSKNIAAQAAFTLQMPKNKLKKGQNQLAMLLAYINQQRKTLFFMVF